MRDDTGASLVRAGIGAWLALIALQVAWHGFLAPPASMSRLAAVAWAVVPIALPLLVLRRGVNRALRPMLPTDPSAMELVGRAFRVDFVLEIENQRRDYALSFRIASVIPPQ